MNPVRDDTATTCPTCRKPFRRLGRARFCSTACRQTAWRNRSSAPTTPTVTRAATVYECDQCGARSLGDQRCQDCNTWARRVSAGGSCPCCDEPVAITDLFIPEQLT